MDPDRGSAALLLTTHHGPTQDIKKTDLSSKPVRFPLPQHQPDATEQA